MPPAKPANPAPSSHLWWRVGTLLILVIAFVLALISYLNYSNYRKNYLELNSMRHLILAKDLRQSIESGLNIGIAPAENLRLLPIMRELMQRHGGIQYIAVADSTGLTIREGNIPQQSSAYWHKYLSQTPIDSHWKTNNKTTFQIGMPFSNNFNIKVGAVVIGYDRLAIEAATNSMMIKLGINVIQTLLLCCVLIYGGCYFLTRKLTAELERIDLELQCDLKGHPGFDINHASPGLLGPEVMNGISSFSAVSKTVLQEMELLEAGLKSREHS